MINLGFIGTGGMGMYQTRAFVQIRGFKIVAGADPTEGPRKNFAEQFPDAKIYTDHRKLLRDPNVDAVVIAVPTALHKATAVDSLKAGRPTLVEKPMARTVKAARQMIEASRKYGTLLMVAHCRRYDPVWGAFARAITSGKLGRPVLWRDLSAGFGPGGWFMDDHLGGGPLFDAAVHNYDFGNMIFGDPDSVVSSTIKMDPSVTAIDTGSAVVRYKSGDQLVISWSWRARGLGMFDVVGPKGFIQSGTGNLSPPPPEGDGNRHGYYCLTDSKGKQKLIRYPNDSMQMYVAQGRHFLACIKGKAQCRSPGREALKAVAVAEAVLKAGPGGGARKVVW